jgi:hypothetical protein
MLTPGSLLQRLKASPELSTTLPVLYLFRVSQGDLAELRALRTPHVTVQLEKQFGQKKPLPLPIGPHKTRS